MGASLPDATACSPRPLGPRFWDHQPPWLHPEEAAALGLTVGAVVSREVEIGACVTDVPTLPGLEPAPKALLASLHCSAAGTPGGGGGSGGTSSALSPSEKRNTFRRKQCLSTVALGANGVGWKGRDGLLCLAGLGHRRALSSWGGQEHGRVGLFPRHGVPRALAWTDQTPPLSLQGWAAPRMGGLRSLQEGMRTMGTGWLVAPRGRPAPTVLQGGDPGTGRVHSVLRCT